MKRVLTIQDISCFGKCSASAALPVLACSGVEVCLLPALMLSAHTAYEHPVRLDTTDFMAQTITHLQQIEASFDAVLVGYLGGTKQVSIVQDFLRSIPSGAAKVIVDPAMADKGKLYDALPRDYSSAVSALLEEADVVLPNITEASLLLDRPYPKEAVSVADAQEMAASLLNTGAKTVVLTGVGDAACIGACYTSLPSSGFCSSQRTEGDFHGTGDLFAAVFTAAFVRGLSLEECVRAAVRFTNKAVETTSLLSRDRRQGLFFEPLLKDLSEIMKGESPVYSTE